MHNHKYLFLISLLGCYIFTFPISLALDEPAKNLPVVEGTQLEVLYSVEGKVVGKITTPKRLQYRNGDEVYPDGIHVEYYDEHKTIVGELRANTVYHYVSNKQWELKGDVEIKRFQDEKNIQLNTEEAYWNVEDEKIYTDKFVRIETNTELLLGYGLQAKQDLSLYSIQMPQGFVEDELESLSNE
jgi:LPS export ABC transporter protein LptC